MRDGHITLSTCVTVTLEQYVLIKNCARDLELDEDSVIRAVVNTSVRRHFERVSAPREEVTENE